MKLQNNAERESPVYDTWFGCLKIALPAKPITLIGFGLDVSGSQLPWIIRRLESTERNRLDG